MMAEFRRATGDLRSTFEGHMNDLEREAAQRKIGGASPAATPALPPAVTPATGTVPADPPHASAGASSEHTESAESQPEPQEPNPESVSDGGSRPA
jgi:outer membrane biosynthesis protein TonB